VSAVHGLNLDVRPGEFVAISGPSGCGKSTLLHILGGLDPDFTGTVLVDGQDVRALPDPAAFRAGTVGFVFQSFHLLPTLTAQENVEIPMFESGRPRAERRRRAGELLAKVGLAARAKHLPGELSGGERQRVALARSLANVPRLLLADEPTGNLDSTSARVILDLLLEIHRSSEITVVLVTHDAGVAATAQRRVTMLDGRVVAAA
jgi:ABC-type lipoprotein export system ATPase subunit